MIRQAVIPPRLSSPPHEANVLRDAQELRDRLKALRFYENRYGQGYMAEWPVVKKERVSKLLRGLGLPPSGDALDFGCGTGVFTEVLRHALPPSWGITGVDISSTAIGLAKNRHPDCTFNVAEDAALAGRKFDLVFSHHVLEHVHDLPAVLQEIDSLMKSASSALHILPCGNEGSFEHAVCNLRSDRFIAELENRFFFEDEGHLRRLTTAQMVSAMARHGFVLRQQYYSNQFWGAIDWVTLSGTRFVRTFADPQFAKDLGAKQRLRILRWQLLVGAQGRRIAAFVDSRLRKDPKRLQDYVYVGLAAPVYLLAKPIDLAIQAKARQEWTNRNGDRAGSEMYLFFTRS